MEGKGSQVSITLQEAKALKVGQILHTQDGRRWKVNGKVKTWVKSPNRVSVPIKHGLYAHDYITEDNLHLLTLGEMPSPR
jgi:hypothetical protein